LFKFEYVHRWSIRCTKIYSPDITGHMTYITICCIQMHIECEMPIRQWFAMMTCALVSYSNP
jgi:hypothetical protein